MRATSPWRSPTASETYGGHDLADFAQEFLRRDPDYRGDYSLTKARISAEHLDEQGEMEVLARRWGMGFPLRARYTRPRRARALDAGDFRSDRDYRPRATSRYRAARARP